MSLERRVTLLAYGRKSCSPRPQRHEGRHRQGQRDPGEDAQRLHAATVDNPANPAIHLHTTGPEIWDDTYGAVDILISGVGTGGTITGVSNYIKRKRRRSKPSPSSPRTARCSPAASPAPTRFRAIGAGFVPSVLDTKLIDEVVQVSKR